MTAVGQWGGQLTWEARVGGKRLTIVMQPFYKAVSEKHVVAALAVETLGDADTLSQVLTSHSHHNIGEYNDPIQCLKAVKLYIRRWVHDRKKFADKPLTKKQIAKLAKDAKDACDCEDIKLGAQDEHVATGKKTSKRQRAGVRSVRRS